MSVVTDVRLASCETCATGSVLERTLSLTTLHGDPRLVRILVRFDAGANTMQLSTCVCPLCSGCVREPVDTDDLDEEPEDPYLNEDLDLPSPRVSIQLVVLTRVLDFIAASTKAARMASSLCSGLTSWAFAPIPRPHKAPRAALAHIQRRRFFSKWWERLGIEMTR